MEKLENKTFEEVKQALINDINLRNEQGIIEKTNADLIIKLINNAEDINEAITIAELGTTYKRTGFHFVKKLEKMSSNIKYLKKNEDLSFDNSGIHHKLIIGDNYDALQQLLITHKKKIDVIYIDPPYGKDDMGEYALTNYDNAITRDNLLSMLYPRLFLAKELLSNDGVIFCSIDDRNQAYFKCLFDEVFGEPNFIGTYFWKKTETPPSLSKKIRKKYEYILCYGNNLRGDYKFSQGLIDGSDAPLINSGNPVKIISFPPYSVHFNIPDGVYGATDDKKIKLINEVIVQNGLNQNEMKAEARWKWSQDTLQNEVDNGTYFIVKSLLFSVRYQRATIDSVKTPQNNIDSSVGVGTNEEGDKVLKSIVGEGLFSNPKPISLIKYLINMTNKDETITILDFFAGSGTTGHSVLELNKQDGGNRIYILCTNNEITDKNPNGIAYDVTSKRLKRIMTGSCYDGNRDFEWIDDNEALGGSLDVYEIESVANFENTEGKTPFDVIDETNYGLEKFNNANDKIKWVCENFEKTQKYLEGE